MSTNDEIYIESDESDINQINKNTNEKSNCDKIIHKMDLININNGWNDNNEKIIISIADNCASYKWMHEKCSQYHRLVNSIINIAQKASQKVSNEARNVDNSYDEDAVDDGKFSLAT